ncbi:polymer-forming cytoskeletal protein [uncultured Helicobacter sp.]|uniref:bactofilin family protein n=1 Tax=uncultured Helicobacter sp. TaxID=175537 RepID=UPI00374FB38E
MAIFTNDNKQLDGSSSTSGGATIIANGTRIKGEINIECRLHIDGDFEGTITSKDTVMIGRSGIVKGAINTNALVVAGKFIGDSVSNFLELKTHGRIEGTITTNELVVERKGVFIGESKVRDGKGSREMSVKEIIKDTDSKKKD